jgi:hypothetical protein
VKRFTQSDGPSREARKPDLAAASELLHRRIQRRVELVHGRLGFVAHVGDAEGRALDLAVAAINEEALVLDELLEFRHADVPETGAGSIADAGELDRVVA